ncbi:MAG: radical SAM protein [Halobacteriota archaeon]|nr:radical SAM protein [Halobacteriota archaeon]
MKVYLLNPPFVKGFSRGVRGVGEATRGGTLYCPIWLSYAAGVLEQEHEVKLIDAQARQWLIEDVLQDLNRFDPDLIVVETNFSSLNNDLDMVDKIKTISNAAITMVGPPTSQYFEKIIIGNGVGIVARHEYDITLKEVANAIRSGTSLKKIRGISYIECGKAINNPDREYTNSEDLDGMPFVSKTYKKHLNLKDYFLSSSLYPTIQIFTGRGCPNQCTFCSWPETLMGRKYRVRSVANVLDEFEYIENELPEVKEIFIEDDTFTISKKRVLAFCEDYKKRGLNITWSCNARANSLDLETMKEMKKANCRLLIVGYESGNDEILINIKKGITSQHIRDFSKNARKAGLLVHGDFIIGLPGETNETIMVTKKMIHEVKPDLLQVLVPQPVPGTHLYDWCKEHKFLLTEDPNEYLDENGHQKAIISYPELSNEEMVKEVDEILKNYYMSPSYIPLAMRQVLRKNGLDEARRLWYSMRMFLGYVGRR